MGWQNGKKNLNGYLLQCRRFRTVLSMMADEVWLLVMMEEGEISCDARTFSVSQ
jgi:hypothetical protein